jgi:hypothetical protein
MAFAPNAMQEIHHYRDIDDEDENLNWGQVVEQLVNLKRQKRGCDHHGEPLGPTLQSPQANSFGQEQAGIDKADDSEFADPGRGEIRDLLNCLTNYAAVWIETEHRYPMLKQCCNIRMYQFQDPEANHNQTRCLQELEDCDKPNQSAMR